MCAVLVPASTKIPSKKRHYDATRSTYELLLLSSMYIHTPLTKNGFESSYPRLHANPNPSLPSRIAVNNFSFISSSDEYSGRSNWLKQVCAEGKRWLPNAFWILNRRGPSEPVRFANPSKGTLLVPVTNCRNNAFSSFENARKQFQNHVIIVSDGLYPAFAVASTIPYSNHYMVINKEENELGIEYYFDIYNYPKE